jgi:hypothetical protein
VSGGTASRFASPPLFSVAVGTPNIVRNVDMS